MTTITINVPNSEVSFFKKMIKKLGWTYEEVAKPRLYDPETDAYLNDKTMKVIEDARNGEGIAFQGSLEDFKTMAESL